MPGPDLIVIGAGVAGLSAAARLFQAGLRPLVLEARPRIGGRILSISDGPYRIELGAEFIHGRPPEVFALASQGAIAVQEREGRRWCKEDSGFQPCGNSSSFDAIFERLAAWPGGQDSTFNEYLNTHAADLSPSDRAWAVEYVEGFNAADSHRVSVAWLAQEQQSAGGEDGQRIFVLPQGYARIPELLSTGLDVRTSAPVSKIEWRRGLVRVHSALGIVEASRVVLTAPLPAYARITFDPHIHAHTGAAAQLAMGQAIRVSFRFAGRFWTRLRADWEDLSILHTHDPAFPTWWTRQPLAEPILTGWSGGPKALRVCQLPDAEIVAEAEAALKRTLGNDWTAQAVHLHNWQTDPYALGAYSYVPVGASGLPAMLAEPVENTLFFAGEATAACGQAGTVHGAISSGYRAAAQILQSLR